MSDPPKFSSVTSKLGRRFSIECRKRRISKAQASREMGYRYFTNLCAVLTEAPGKCGPKSRERVEAWFERREVRT